VLILLTLNFGCAQFLINFVSLSGEFDRLVFLAGARPARCKTRAAQPRPRSAADREPGWMRVPVADQLTRL